MSVDHVEVIVEEPSTEVALRLLLPRLLGGTSFQVYSHQCKDELLQRLPDRLRGYANWLPKTWRIVVIVDRDDDECDDLKARLERMASTAGLTTRTKAAGRPYAVANRLAIEELEAWYFGDWEAVRAAYPRVAATIPSQAKYRDPDAIAGGTWEAFERLLQKIGYFTTGLRKIEAARAITPHMEPARNRSRSFQTLRTALLEMV
ncbi:MAG: DUF4276 family protein [Deltaproteobacteria bacterium]|nr:DUF4276 family protein [Deltaproteobacteria bacterium]